MTNPSLKSLSDDQLMRYSRHIMLPQLDIDGQEQIYNSKILIIGVGGLGCAVAQYLAVSGVGMLTLVDDDEVERTNLQRQVLHTETSVGVKKVNSAKTTLEQLNSDITIRCFDTRLNDEQLIELIKQHDVVMDCTDNLATRDQLNKLCYSNKTPLVSGAAIRMEGQVSTFMMKDNEPCYQCLSQMFGEQNLTCSEAGILSPVVGMIGCIQATECLKLITHVGKPLSGRLLMVDAATMQFNEFKLTQSPLCPICSGDS